MNKTPLSSYRWTICALLFFATTINYIDRQILSLLKPILDGELHWTNQQFGWVNALFQGAYAFSYLFFGWFIDRFGVKLGYALSISAWSLAAGAHALVNSIGGFAMARVALGLGEGGNFPAAIKAVSIWFANKERVLATTLFNSGANVGALLAPAFIPPLALAFGWQWAFIAAGAAGFLWLAAWLVWFQNPVAEAISDADANGRPAPKMPWKSLLGYRQTWAFLLAKLLTDPVWWFLLIWLPDYCKQTRGLDLKAMGLPLIVIYSVVTVLSVAGGWLTVVLSRHVKSVTSLRRFALLFFACSVVPIGGVPSRKVSNNHSVLRRCLRWPSGGRVDAGWRSIKIPYICAGDSGVQSAQRSFGVSDGFDRPLTSCMVSTAASKAFNATTLTASTPFSARAS